MHITNCAQGRDRQTRKRFEEYGHIGMLGGIILSLLCVFYIANAIFGVDAEQNKAIRDYEFYVQYFASTTLSWILNLAIYLPTFAWYWYSEKHTSARYDTESFK